MKRRVRTGPNNTPALQRTSGFAKPQPKDTTGQGPGKGTGVRRTFQPWQEKPPTEAVARAFSGLGSLPAALQSYRSLFQPHHRPLPWRQMLGQNRAVRSSPCGLQPQAQCGGEPCCRHRPQWDALGTDVMGTTGRCPGRNETPWGKPRGGWGGALLL